MSEEGSISLCIQRLKAGESAVAQELYERYFYRVVGLARRKLDGMPNRVADEEDVAQDAFASFFRGVERSRYPLLNDRDDLWRLLAVIAARKAIDQVHHQRRQKRGSGMVRGESILVDLNSDGQFGLAELAIAEIEPGFGDALTSQCEVLLNKLEDEGLRSLALLKMEGFTNEEIAEKLGCARRTVRRRLKLIRELWSEGEAAR